MGYIPESGSWTIGGNTYHHRLPIAVKENSGGALANYTVLATVNSAWLVSNNYATSSGNEIRFAKSDNTLLDFWRENEFNISGTKYWVEVDSLPAGATITIYIYFDEELTGVSSASNIKTSFICGDDFEDGSLDTDLFDTYLGNGSIAETGGVLRITCPSDLRCDWWTTVNEAPRAYYKNSLYGQNFIVYAKMKGYSTYPASSLGAIFITQTPTTGNDTLKNMDQRGTESGQQRIGYQKFGSAWVYDASTLDPVFWRIEKNGTTYNFKYSSDGDTWTSKGTPTETYNPIYAGMAAKTWDTAKALQIDFELFTIRKYVSPEPTVTISQDFTHSSVAPAHNSRSQAYDVTEPYVEIKAPTWGGLKVMAESFRDQPLDVWEPNPSFPSVTYVESSVVYTEVIVGFAHDIDFLNRDSLRDQAYKVDDPLGVLGRRPFKISGKTRDGKGDPLGSCVVRLVKRGGGGVEQETTSDVNGDFTFYVREPDTEYFVIAYKTGTPNRMGRTEFVQGATV